MATQYIVVKDDKSTNYFVVSLNVSDVDGTVPVTATQGEVYATANGVSRADAIRDKLNS